MDSAPEKAEYVYVTYINSTAEKVFSAITEPKFTEQYWSQHHNVSDWKVGSRWTHQDAADGSIVDVVGKVLENDRPNKLVISWASPRFEADASQYSRVTFDIVEDRGLVRLTVTHADLQAGSTMLKSISGGWPIVLSGLKTFVESGMPMPTISERKDGKWVTVRFG
ncbi:MAG: SRPBCC family protein [Gemmatimonadota bacterium]|nr:SRPBCC family protein [Gemmatimonadota bacterium]